MYIPSLHARRSEKNAVLAIAKHRDKLLPLICPVELAPAIELVRFFTKGDIPYIFLTTPITAKPAFSQADMLQVLRMHGNPDRILPAVAVTAAKPLTVLKAEIAALGAQPYAVLHVSESPLPAKLHALLAPTDEQQQWHLFRSEACSQAYADNWKNKPRAIIEECFVRQQKNADYAAVLDEAYNSLPFTYAGRGFQGFGDATVVGHRFTPSGGPALTVALHLTYPKASEVRVRHFVSKSDPAIRVPPKYLDAQSQLVAFYRANAALAFSDACAEFERHHKAKHFPGLPTAKKLCIQHHIELMLELAP
jgi:hypothetical protein